MANDAGKNIHSGHRERLRERFEREGLDSFEPHEALELLLFYGKANGDTNALAHTLLDTFGSLKGVLEAGTGELQQVEGIGPRQAVLISMMVPMFRKYAESLCLEKRRILNVQDAIDYATALLAGRRDERFCMILLRADRSILSYRIIAEGTLDSVAAYPRRVAAALLESNAQSVIFCHNHPGGVAVPSAEDLNVTRSLTDLIRKLGAEVTDHIILAGDTAYSMAQHGDLTLEKERT